MAEKIKGNKFPLLPKIINGGIAGIVGVTCVFPIDLVKTRLQNQQPGPDGKLMYKNMLDCFRQTFKQDGFFGMYRGSAVNLILITPEKAIKLAANDFFRFRLRTSQNTLPLPRQMLAGGLAGFFQIIVTTPMELLKIQMQDAGRVAAKDKAEGREVKKLTASKLAIGMVKQHGIFGLYRGLGATMLRDVTFSVMYFPMFATLNDLGPKKQSKGSQGDDDTVFWWTFLSGLMGGLTSAFFVTPLDVVKTRLQLVQKGKGEKEYKNIPDCFIKTLRYEGVQALFKGGFCRMMVLAPLFGIAQVVYYLGVAEAMLTFIGYY